MSESLMKKISLILIMLILAQIPVFAQTGPVSLGAALGVIGPVGDFRNNVGELSLPDKGGLNFDLILGSNSKN